MLKIISHLQSVTIQYTVQYTHLKFNFREIKILNHLEMLRLKFGVHAFFRF